MNLLIITASLATAALTFWPTYHGDYSLTGYSGCEIPDKPSLLWRTNMGSEVSGTPIADSIFIFAATRDGKLSALDMNGQTAWSIRIEGATFASSPACANDYIVIGSVEGRVYAFSKKDGTQVWNYDTGDSMGGSVAFSLDKPNRVVAVGQASGSVHCLDLQSGKLIWKADSTNRCDGSPAVTSGIVAFGNCDAAIHVFPILSGKKLLQIELGPDGQVAGGITILNESAFVGTHGGNVIGVNIISGKILWTFAGSNASIYATPAVYENNLIVTSNIGKVYCLDPSSGHLKWTADTGGTPSSPVMTDSKVIVSSDGLLHIFSLDSGAKLWSYEAGDEITSPAIVNNMIIVAGDDGMITAFGAK